MFHLIKIGSKWALKKAGSKRVSKTFKTKRQGEKEAYKYAEKGEVVAIHSPTGFIERTIKPNKKDYIAKLEIIGLQGMSEKTYKRLLVWLDNRFEEANKPDYLTAYDAHYTARLMK